MGFYRSAAARRGPASYLILLLVSIWSMKVGAQASGSGSPANLPQSWPPKVEQDGYLPGAPGYTRFPGGPSADYALIGCAERGGPHGNARVALGPVDAEGWVEYIDLLRCDSDKRLLRIKAPNAQLAPYTDSKGLIESRQQAIRSFHEETGHGSLLTLRSGEVKWLDLRLKEVDYDPERTLFVGRSALHLLDEPGLFLPYLKPGERFQLPKGMKGFTWVQPLRRLQPHDGVPAVSEATAADLRPAIPPGGGARAGLGQRAGQARHQPRAAG